MENTFLAANKEYLNIGLKSIDILIIAQIEEFRRNKRECYVTNKQFAEMFGESEDKIKRSLAKLEKMNVIKRNTIFIDGNGRSNRQRMLSVNDKKEWKAHIAPSKMEGAKVNNGRCKNNEWKEHNTPIKENIKDKEKDNITKTKNIKKILELSYFDEDLQEDIDLGLAIPEDCLSEKFYFFAIQELDRLGDNINFIISYDKIESYKNDKCMGSCYETC